MTKIKTRADLKKWKEEVQSRITLQKEDGYFEERVQVKVAMATCGIASGAKDVKDFMMAAFSKRGIDADVIQTGCMGYCYAEPTIEVTVPGKEPVVFGYVDVKKADDIIEKYIKKGILPEGIIPVNYQTIE